MRQCGASTGAVDAFVAILQSGRTVSSALTETPVPLPVRTFVEHTFGIINRGDLCAIASAFALGREDLLPDLFRRIVDELDGVKGGDLSDFRYYLDRHIDLDGGEHGSLASKLIEDLCGDDRDRWQAAEDAASASLLSRLALWDRIGDRLGN